MHRADRQRSYRFTQGSSHAWHIYAGGGGSGTAGGGLGTSGTLTGGSGALTGPSSLVAAFGGSRHPNPPAILQRLLGPGMAHDVLHLTSGLGSQGPGSSQTRVLVANDDLRILATDVDLFEIQVTFVRLIWLCTGNHCWRRALTLCYLGTKFALRVPIVSCPDEHFIIVRTME